MARAEPSVRAIFRIVGVVLVSAIALYLLYLLRKPIGWVAMATFIAIALSAPVDRLGKRMPRGLAITCVYLGLVLVPVALGALIVPPLVTQGTELVDDLPAYANDVQEFVNENERLREIDE